MLSCPISKTDFSFQAELLTHLTSVPLICATMVRVHQPLSHAHTTGHVCTKSGQRGSRGLEVITLFYLIFFPFMRLLWTLRNQTCHSKTQQLTTQLQIPTVTQTLAYDLSRRASRYSGIMFPLCTKVPGFVAPTPLSLLLKSSVCA